MEQKNIVATLYLKDGKAVKSRSDLTEIENVFDLCRIYNDSGIDKIFIFDLSDDDEEHENNIQTIQKLNRNLEVKVCAGGNINRIEDIKKLLYAGCVQVLLNASKPSSIGLAKEASAKFGKDRIMASLDNVDFLFKHKELLDEMFHEFLIMDKDIIDAVENLTTVPYVVYLKEFQYEEIVELLKRKKIRGISGPYINDIHMDVMKLKSALSSEGIKMDNFAPNLHWEDLKLNSDGMVPVIVQDYRTDEVLMLAYMNKEAFDTTINIGKMTYWSRSRNELWTKGLTSGHVQYVKSLSADCDFDTILAKVSQVGVACHTGEKSCFFREIVKKEYVDKNPQKIFDEVYQTIQNRKKEPKEGSYTNLLLSKGEDGILRKLGEEFTEMVISAKSQPQEKLKYEMADLFYHLMVLMAEKGLTWEDITSELAQR